MRPKLIIEKIPSLRGQNSFISKIRKELGIPPFRRSRITGWRSNGVQSRIDQSRRLRHQGWTLDRIGKKMGITRERVRQYLLKAA
jgi:Sigma-70, region 4